MKRSEMIDLMVEKSMEKHYLERMDTQEFPKRLAETMLLACEEAGMLPPGRKEDELTFTSFDDGTILGKCFERHIWDEDVK